jgi:bifunctional enzyme CysN/CysC
VADADLIAQDIQAYLARHQRKDILRFLTAGSVDDGKSTLIGRLLYDSNTVYDDQVAALRRDSAQKSSAGGEIDYSLLVDGLLSEREQGITIDVAYRYFSTEKRKFIIADTPGHEQYTRNMATGASTADLAIVLIDARQGVLRQTRRHSFIASLLGIRHLVVAVNKMDLVDYAEDVFAAIRRDYLEFAAKLDARDASAGGRARAPAEGALDLHFIPLSALKGDNVVEPSAVMPWYSGPPLLRYLETVPIDRGERGGGLRFPVQHVSRPNLDFRGFSGSVAGGVVRPGDAVMALPSRRVSRVRSIVTYGGDLDEARPPQAVTLTLEDEIDVSRGDMLVHPGDLPHVARSASATLVWMHDTPMRPGTTYLLKHTTHKVTAEVTALQCKIDVNTLAELPADELGLNEIGLVELTAARPLVFDAYRDNRATGSFILIDRRTNATVGAGMIRASLGGAGAGEATTKTQRTPGFVVWFTGLSGAGKSTLSALRADEVRRRGVHVEVLDGDEVRTHLSKGLGFSKEDRDTNVRRIGYVAKLLARAGACAMTAAISPYRDVRDEQRAMIPHFVEVYCSCTVEALAERDVKGLYKKALAGEIKHFTGIDDPYEPPERPEVVVHTDREPKEESLARILAKLEELGLVPRESPAAPG